MLLDEIINQKKQEIAGLKERFSGKNIEAAMQMLALPADFAAALSKDKISLIAEIKKASPSAGLIRPDFDPVKIAQTYEAAGASAISVLTDEKFFQGKTDYLMQVKQAVGLPVLRKDFIIDELQVYQARMFAADAVLLIARILSDVELIKLLCVTHNLGMQALVEVHNEEELVRVLNTEAKIIGINNRDLDSLTIDLNTTPRLIEKFPQIKERIIVSESGIKTKEDVEKLAGVGVKAILVGETLMKSSDILGTIKELIC